MSKFKLNQKVIIPSMKSKGQIVQFLLNSDLVRIKTKDDIILISEKLITLYSLIKWLITLISSIFKKRKKNA